MSSYSTSTPRSLTNIEEGQLSDIVLSPVTATVLNPMSPQATEFGSDPVPNSQPPSQNLKKNSTTTPTPAPTQIPATARVDSSPRINRDDYHWSPVWIVFLILYQIFLCIPPLFFSITMIKTAGYLSIVGLSSSFIISMTVIMTDPFRSERKSSHPIYEVISISLTMCHIIFESVGVMRRKGIPVPYVIYVALFSIVFYNLMKKRKRITTLANKSKAHVRNHIVKTLPLTFIASSLSMSYLASESVGCIVSMIFPEDLSAPEIDCMDIIKSNHVLSFVFCGIFYAKVYVAPFAQKQRTYEEIAIIRFDFSFKEQIQLGVFCMGSFAALLVFASRTVETDDKSVADADIDIDDNKKGFVRNLLVNFCYLCLSFSILMSFSSTTKTSQGMFQRAKLFMTSPDSTTLSGFYRAILALSSLSLFLYTVLYIFFVLKRSLQEGELSEKTSYATFLCDKYYGYSRATWPLMMYFTACYFFSRPLGKFIRTEIMMYCIVPLMFALLGFGIAIHRFDFILSLEHITTSVFLFLFARIAIKSRNLLRRWGVLDIESHLLSMFYQSSKVLPTMAFLWAESSGCLMRADWGGSGRIEDAETELSLCDGNTYSNLAASTHLSLTFIFLLSFGYELTRLSWQELSQLNFDSHPLLKTIEVLCVMLASSVSFICFGLRDQTSTLLVPYTKLMPNAIVVCWGIAFCVRGYIVSKKESVEEERAEMGLKELAAVRKLLTKIRKKREKRERGEGEQCGGRSVSGDTSPLGKRGKMKKNLRVLSTKVEFALKAKSEVIIAPVYRSIVILGMVCPQALLALYMIDLEEKYYYLYESMNVFVLFLAVLLFNSTFQDFSVKESILLVVTPVLGYGYTFLKVQVGDFDLITALWHTANFVCVCFVVFLLYKSKKSLKMLYTQEEKNDHVVNNGFVRGMIGGMPAMLYLTSESVGCILRNTDMIEECDSLIIGDKAVNLHMLAIFVYGVNFVPLTVATVQESFESWILRVVKMELTASEKIKVSLFVVISFIVLILFGSRNSGLQISMTLVAYKVIQIGWLAVFSYEAYLMRWKTIEDKLEELKIARSSLSEDDRLKLSGRSADSKFLFGKRLTNYKVSKDKKFKNNPGVIEGVGVEPELDEECIDFNPGLM